VWFNKPDKKKITQKEKEKLGLGKRRRGASTRKTRVLHARKHLKRSRNVPEIERNIKGSVEQERWIELPRGGGKLKYYLKPSCDTEAGGGG